MAVCIAFKTISCRSAGRSRRYDFSYPIRTFNAKNSLIGSFIASQPPFMFMRLYSQKR